MKGRALTITCLFAACASSHNAREHAEQSAQEAGIYFEGQGPFAPVREEEFSAAAGEALVQESVRCCEQVGLSYEATPPRAEAFARAFAPADPESGARFQAEAAAACLAELEKRVCRYSKDPPLAEAENPCQALYLRGSRKPGEPCTSPWDCASGGADTVAVCSGERGAASCTLRRVLREGQPCMNGDLNALCDAQLFCDPARNECVARAALGRPCVTGPSFGDTCAAGSVCDRQNTKRCVRARAAGERCSAPEECEDLACVDGVCLEPLAARTICGDARPGPLRR